MSVIIVFLVAVFGFSAWWLAHQRLHAKPWLEVGPDPVGGPGPGGMPSEKIALGVFLAVVGALFALFASAYFMRMGFSDWRATPAPRILWVNTGLLLLACVALRCAVAGVRQGDGTTLRIGLGAGAGATLAFLAGQLLAWRDLAAGGHGLAAGPASSFFYALTGLHGLHILGGLLALAWVLPAARGPGDAGRLRLRVELCATYWDFLLLVWLGLMALLTGGASRFIDICRAIVS